MFLGIENGTFGMCGCGWCWNIVVCVGNVILVNKCVGVYLKVFEYIYAIVFIKLNPWVLYCSSTGWKTFFILLNIIIMIDQTTYAWYTYISVTTQFFPQTTTQLIIILFCPHNKPIAMLLQFYMTHNTTRHSSFTTRTFKACCSHFSSKLIYWFLPLLPNWQLMFFHVKLFDLQVFIWCFCFVIDWMWFLYLVLTNLRSHSA